MSRYINDKGQAAPAYITDEQWRRVYHPTEAMLEAAGYHKAAPHQPTEGWLTDEEYAPTKAQRQQWRERINELEGGGDR